MAAILHAADLTPEDLGRLLAELHFPEEHRPRAWLEAADGWSLDYWPGLAGDILWYGARRLAEPVGVKQVLPRLTAGRIFAQCGELRWRRLEGLKPHSCRTLYLGEDLGCLPRLKPTTELEGLTPRHDEYPLWGLLTETSDGRDGEPPAWIELRVPHRFRYPVDRGKASGERSAVKAVVQTWLDGRGDPHFLRLCDLEPYAAGRGE